MTFSFLFRGLSWEPFMPERPELLVLSFHSFFYCTFVKQAGHEAEVHLIRANVFFMEY